MFKKYKRVKCFSDLGTRGKFWVAVEGQVVGENVAQVIVYLATFPFPLSSCLRVRC